MHRLLQISDPHFGTAQPAVMEALAELARQQRPDVLVLSGDITQRATAAQFDAARAFCDRLQIPRMLTLPGNHDIPLFNPWQRLFTPYARYLRAFGPELEPVLDLAWLQLSTVNTTRRWRHKNGEVSARQIERVSARLRQAAPGQLRVVVVHQPVYVLRAVDEHDRLRGWEPAVRAWAAAGADIVMGGHIHLPYVCELSSCVDGLPRRLWCVQAGTALSSRIRREAPNSVNLLLCDPAADPPAGRLERWDYRSAGGGRFDVAHTSELVLDRAA
jgi:3',5'-cyclic AMP phosphodiesterase CpdA